LTASDIRVGPVSSFPLFSNTCAGLKGEVRPIPDTACAKQHARATSGSHVHEGAKGP
jgi:hypothetical protein